MSQFLWISDIFSKTLCEIGKLRKHRRFDKLQMMKLGPKHFFKNIAQFMVKSILSMTQVLEKLRIFMFFCIFRQFFVQFVSYFFAKMVLKTQQ